MTSRENMQTLPLLHKKPDWSFYIAWVSSTTLCVPAAYLVVIIMLRIVTSFMGEYIYVNGVKHITEDYLALYFLVPSMGLLTGAVQYGLLHGVLPRMGWWIPSTVGGWLLGALLCGAFFRWYGMEPFNMGLVFLLFGLSIGFGQWLVLRRRLSAAGWWMAASLLGWALLVPASKGSSIGQGGLLLLGFFPACVTAVALALLLKQEQMADSLPE
jgi:hypothetical protein